jgi:NADH:ubiquinone oxidoreductase subunit 6 (subunit J)
MLLAFAGVVAIIAVSVLDRPPVQNNSSPTVLSADHVAHLGAELFGRHLVSVEAAGTILLVALVGAIAIVIQGKDEPDRAQSTETPSRRIGS